MKTQPPADGKLTEGKLVNSARELLDNSVQQLDADTEDRLKAIRKTALQQTHADKKSAYAATALAASLLLAVGIGVLWLDAPRPAPGNALEDLIIVGSMDESGLYEDMDFYYWLDEAENHG
jgi:hypothetical protein